MSLKPGCPARARGEHAVADRRVTGSHLRVLPDPFAGRGLASLRSGTHDITVSEETQQVVVLITVDRETSSASVVRSDGKEARFPLGRSPFTDSSVLSRLHYTPAVDGLVAVTHAEDKIFFELPKRRGADQLAGRLVVYLDQNQWSVVAKAMHDPMRVREKDRDAAERLRKWVQQRRIVLSASAGHYYETTKWLDKEAQYNLGLTVLQLSQGWQMRDPLQVRRDELHDAFCRRFTQEDGVRNLATFTLTPNVIHGAWRGGKSYVPPSGFAPDAAFQHEALTSATALIDVMLDAEPIESGSDAGWTQANQRFGDWLDGEDRDAQQKRKSIDAFILSDLQAEIAEEARAAGATLEQLRHWIMNQAMTDVRQLPATGLFREMMHDRHLNKGTVWKSNDLTDMVYLSCAAGYADFVVCERHMGAVLTQGIRRLGRKPRVFRQLHDAVPAIEAALAKPTP